MVSKGLEADADTFLSFGKLSDSLINCGRFWSYDNQEVLVQVSE
ncbi:hypothetical protein BVRB_4g075590 [Beta vulgaris subsp. vulgaris]|nr:hypothetical protein BVRB_4g075590 [Beta vulgaris subsp. vulgaris]